MNSSQPLSFAPGRPPRWWAAAGGVEVTVVLPSLLAGVCVVGLGGNLLLLAILSYELRRGGGKSSPANALLLNLCSADLILLLYCAPTRIATYSRRSWVFGGFVCKTTNWLLRGCLVAKCLTWAAVGQARYQHVLSSSSSSSCQCRSGWKRRLAAILPALWAAALLLPLPHLIFTHLDFSPRTELFYCVFQSPLEASNFLDVFSKVYPLVAYLAPSGFSWSCYWRALRVQEERRRQKRLATPGGPQSSSSRRATWLLLGLSALFQAMWLPEWVVWLWERHSSSPPGAGGSSSPQPPAALRVLAEVLLFLNSSLSPGVFMASSAEFREGLRSAWSAASCQAAEDRPAAGAGGESPQSLRDLKAAAAAEKVLPDVEHFWEDRRHAAPGEESDPVPWEHQ